jgi:hemerythrin-like domain-containing protein
MTQLHPTPSARVDTRDMLLIHRVIRREIGLLPALVRRTSGDVDRATTLAAHAVEMLDFLHHHHTGEDELMWPLLRDRVRLEAALIDRMEEQHTHIAEAIDDVRRLLASWSASADAAVGDRIATRLEEAARLLDEHLAEEETRVLPLVGEHLTQQEWDALAKHGFDAIPGRRRLAILGHILEEADDEERRRFRRKLPPPARVAFRLVGRRQHAREVARIRG